MKKNSCSAYFSLGLIGLFLKEANNYSELWSLYKNRMDKSSASDSHSWKLVPVAQFLKHKVI